MTFGLKLLNEKPEMADPDTIIYVGDTIMVPKNAAVILKLNSYQISAIYLKGVTEFEVKSKYKIKTMGDIFEALISLREKIVSFGDTNEEFEIETNRANTSIKGTIVVVKDDGMTSSLKVLEGAAEFTDNATGKTVSVKRGLKFNLDYFVRLSSLFKKLPSKWLESMKFPVSLAVLPTGLSASELSLYEPQSLPSVVRSYD